MRYILLLLLPNFVDVLNSQRYNGLKIDEDGKTPKQINGRRFTDMSNRISHLGFHCISDRGSSAGSDGRTTNVRTKGKV